MDDFDGKLAKPFSDPICPTCATSYDPRHYDIYEDHACCPNCGTEYSVPAEYRLLHPEDYLEHGVAATLQTIALSRFRIEVRRIADTTIEQTAGASYELYERRFTAACTPYIKALAPDLRTQALAIANHYGYIEDEDARYADFGPGYCSLTGIDENYCHCGRHE